MTVVQRIFSPLRRYADWLHLKWPAGKVEALPQARPDGTTNVPGLSIVGDLTGVPLLKLSLNAGVRAVRRIAGELKQDKGGNDDVLDVAIVGGGTAGFAAAKEAHKLGLNYCVFEAREPFATINDFQKGKPIYTYPTDVEVEGDLVLHEKSAVKEGLLEDFREQTVDADVRWACGRVSHVERAGGNLELVIPDGVSGEDGLAGSKRVRARRVIVAIGRTGDYRRLNVPGEDRGKVQTRLHDPADHEGQDVLVVGGGDSALEAAVALADADANVTLSYRGEAFNRPKADNVEKVERLAAKGSLDLLLGSTVKQIGEASVQIETQDGTQTLPNDVVFVTIGREAPLDFFRRSGVNIRNERDTFWWTSLAIFLVFCLWLYHWKAGEPLLGVSGWTLPAWLNLDPAPLLAWLTGTLPEAFGTYFADQSTLGGTVVASAHSRSFYYSFTYCAVIVGFGIDRVIRKPTPYIKWQTGTLAVIQCVPLFLLPEILLPWMGRNGWFDGGFGAWLAGTLFPNESWWRAYGLILAWPLLVWNWFTDAPIWGWIMLGIVQTFVLIPGMIWFWGKGAYCGWICSCGALAETLGDRHRHKMPHGLFWNKVNFVGQALLLLAIGIQALFVLRWMGVGWAAGASDFLASSMPLLSWKWFVDLLWAGVIGVGFYFWLSGRVWCRFACPLAALMHIYHRFSRFAILADKKKCISCNVCTSVCHQGIDVMSFANKGKPMLDPQCVRCSACVQECPTGVLSFGQIDRNGNVVARDPSWLWASPVRQQEALVALTVNGKKPQP